MSDRGTHQQIRPVKHRRIIPLVQFPFASFSNATPIARAIVPTAEQANVGSRNPVSNQNSHIPSVEHVDDTTYISLPTGKQGLNTTGIFTTPSRLQCKRYVPGHTPHQPLVSAIYIVDLHSTIQVVEFEISTKKRSKSNPWMKGETIVKSVMDVSNMDVQQVRNDQGFTTDVMASSFITPGDRLLMVQDKFQHPEGLQVLGSNGKNVVNIFHTLQRPVRLYLERKCDVVKNIKVSSSTVQYGPRKMEYRLKGGYTLDTLVGSKQFRQMPEFQGRVPPPPFSLFALPRGKVHSLTQGMPPLFADQSGNESMDNIVKFSSHLECARLHHALKQFDEKHGWPTKQADIDKLITMVALVDVSPGSKSYFINDKLLFWEFGLPHELINCMSSKKFNLRIRLFLAGSPEINRGLWAFLLGSFYAGCNPATSRQAFARLTEQHLRAIFEYAGYNSGYTFAGTMRYLGRAYVKRNMRDDARLVDASVMQMCRPGVIFNEAFTREINAQKYDNLVQVYQRTVEHTKVVVRKPTPKRIPGLLPGP